MEINWKSHLIEFILKKKLNDWGYPLHPESDYSKPPEGDFGTWVGLILVFTMMILGILKLQEITWLPFTNWPTKSKTHTYCNSDRLMLHTGFS